MAQATERCAGSLDLIPRLNLAELIDAWPTLSEAIYARIVAMVTASRVKPEDGPDHSGSLGLARGVIGGRLHSDGTVRTSLAPEAPAPTLTCTATIGSFRTEASAFSAER